MERRDRPERRPLTERGRQVDQTQRPQEGTRMKPIVAHPVPTWLAETLDTANRWYFAIYGVRPYPPVKEAK